VFVVLSYHTITYESALLSGPYLGGGGGGRRHHNHFQHAVLTTYNKNRILQLNHDLNKFNNFVDRTLNVLL